MKSKFTKLLATALVLCLVLALLPAAAFAEGEHTVTVQNNAGQVPANGKVTLQTNEGTPYIVSSDNNSFKANADATITVSVEPNSEDYKLDYIKLNGEPLNVSGGVAKFTMPDNDVILEVVFQHVWSITIDDDIQNGKVCCQISALANEIVTITATPNTGYELEAFHVYGAGTNGQEDAIPTTPDTTDKNKATFTMPNHAVIVSATFEAKETFAITTATSELGYVTAPASAYEGQVVSVSATATASGASVESIKITKTSDGEEYRTITGASGTFDMPAFPVTVKAVFGTITPPVTDTYSIDLASSIAGGEIWSSANSAKAGETVYIYVYPERGWTTKDVYYKTTADSGIVPTWQNLTHEYWKDTQSYEVWSFEMPNHDVYVYADFTYYHDYGAYYIDTSYDSTLGGVEVWVNNNYVNNWHQGSWADHNDTVSFKVKPYYSDDVVSVSVVGKRTGWNYSCDYNSYSGWYTFSMPKEDVTISVDFRSGVHKVYVDKVTDGKLTVSDDWAKYGQIVYITAVPDYGCTLSSLSVRTATGDSVRVYNAQKADTYYFYMPDQYVSVSAVFTGKYTSVPFNDVSYGDWYYNAVQFVYSRGIMDGVDYYKFAPNGTITRGMILTMLWRMAGEPFEMPVTSFTDVEIGRYYTTAVAWACRNGIADGMGESTFGPNDAITREELVTLLYRYAQYFGHSCIGTSIEGFADAGSVSSYAYNAMCWAYKAGVVTGTTGSRLNPQGTASRAEAAQMIMSFYSFLNS